MQRGPVQDAECLFSCTGYRGIGRDSNACPGKGTSSFNILAMHGITGHQVKDACSTGQLVAIVLRSGPSKHAPLMVVRAGAVGPTIGQGSVPVGLWLILAATMLSLIHI